MRKKLLTSVSLFAALISAPSFSEHIVAHSNDFKITLGADVNLQSGMRFQSSSKYKKCALANGNPCLGGTGSVIKTGPSANNDSYAFTSTAHAHLGAENKTKDGTTYGVHVGLFASTRGSFPSRDHLGRTYAYLENDNWGRFEIGTKKGASSSMQLDGDEVVGGAGTGGAAGDWDKYLSLNSFKGTNFNEKATAEDNFASGSSMVIKDSSSTANNEGARKMTYYSPTYNGFQLGLSFMPDVANKGGNKSEDSPFVDTGPTRDLKNAFMAGLSYEKQIDKKQSIKVVLVAETGKLVASAGDKIAGRSYTKNPFGFDIGAIYTYDKFSVAGSYGEAGKYKYRTATNPKKTIFYTAGLGYQVTKKVRTALTYFHSDNRNKLDVVSVGAGYDWASGVQPYAELTHVIAKQKYDYDLKGKTETGNDAGSALNSKTRGTVAILGVRFSF